MSKLITVERSITRPFRAVEIRVLQAKITVGKPHSGISLSGESHILRMIATRVRGDVLQIKPREDANFSTDEPLTVEFSLEGLDRLQASAGAKVELLQLRGGVVELSALSGAQLKAEGRLDSVLVTAQSGGTVDLRKLQARNVSSEGRSGGRVLS